jgi:DNA-binding beta-propeller fold protein YncE
MTRGHFSYQWGSFGAGDGQFNEPIGVAVDADGTVAVGDTWNGRVQYFSHQTAVAEPTRRRSRLGGSMAGKPRPMTTLYRTPRG